jgi:hypothetical protein
MVLLLLPLEAVTHREVAEEAVTEDEVVRAEMVGIGVHAEMVEIEEIGVLVEMIAVETVRTFESDSKNSY